MNAALDYDTLEMLGAAIRDSRSQDLRDPLPDRLRELCDQLSADSSSRAKTEAREAQASRPRK